jgi:hypothetical protein
MALIRVNGAQLHREVRGVGPPVLLIIMGVTGDAGHFETVADLFAGLSSGPVTPMRFGGSSTRGCWFHSPACGGPRERLGHSASLQEVMLRIHRHADELERSSARGAGVYAIAGMRSPINTAPRQFLASGRPESTSTARSRSCSRAPRGILAASSPPGLGPLLEGVSAPQGGKSRSLSWRGLIQASAAGRLGLATAGMKSRVQRGRAKLKELLDACCESEFAPPRRRQQLPATPGSLHCRTGTPVLPRR